MWTSRELVLPRWRQKPYFMAAALVFLSNLSSENLVVLPFWIWIESEAKQAASTGKIIPPVDLATFSAAPLPWAWVPGWILTVVAVSGNTLVIYLIATNRRLQTQVNLFIMSLAIADFCFGLTYFPAFFTCEFYLPCDQELRQIFAAYFAFASLTNLCVMTVDRYVAIVMPFKYIPIMTSRCIVAMVFLGWLFPTVLYFLIAVILKQLASEDIFITFKISRLFVF